MAKSAKSMSQAKAKGLYHAESAEGARSRPVVWTKESRASRIELANKALKKAAKHS